MCAGGDGYSKKHMAEKYIYNYTSHLYRVIQTDLILAVSVTITSFKVFVLSNLIQIYFIGYNRKWAGENVNRMFCPIAYTTLIAFDTFYFILYIFLFLLLSLFLSFFLSFSLSLSLSLSLYLSLSLSLSLVNKSLSRDR